MFTLASASAQYAGVPAQGPDPNQSLSQPAPVVRAGGADRFFDTQPSAGVSVRSDVQGGVQTVTASGGVTELRIEQGRADVTVHRPADHSEILVDLPGGQVSLIKDGFYTFNAQSDTVRVLHGEAVAYTGAKDAEKGTKVKETQQLSFNGGVKLRSVDAYPYELTADLLPGRASGREDGYEGGYGRGFYGGYPYYAGGFYPYGYGYPYAFGYPYYGVGLGFGYYGGYGRFGGVRGFRR